MRYKNFNGDENPSSEFDFMSYIYLSQQQLEHQQNFNVFNSSLSHIEEDKSACNLASPPRSNGASYRLTTLHNFSSQRVSTVSKVLIACLHSVVCGS